MKKLEPDLDTLLKKWPAPSKAEPAWDVQADAIAAGASARPKGDAVLATLLEAPALPPEPGEPSGRTAGRDARPSGETSEPDPSGVMPAELRVSGERKMSDDKDRGQGAAPSQPRASTPASIDAPRSKRQSLREIAERASQAGATRSQTPLPGAVSSVSTPLPGAVSTPLPGAPSSKSAVSTPLPRSATATPLPSRPVEAGKEDSGIVDLNVIRSMATPQEIAAAEKAQPASEGLFDDDDKPEAAASARAAAPAKGAAKGAAKAAPPAKKGSGGAVAGIAIAVLGIAAAFAMYQQRERLFPHAAPAPVVAETKQEAPAPTAEATGEVAVAPPATGEPAATGEAEGPVALNGPPRPVPGGGALGPGRTPAPTPEAKPAPAPGKPAEKGTEKAPGDLAGAMEKAVGPTDKSGDSAEKGEPAAGSKSSSIPEQPPQGSVSAAVGSVMGGAKACVGGADDVSRATITFSSNGSVSSVTVTGWAAAHGQTGCVKAALQGAKVGAFSKPTFSVGVTIRP